MNLLAALWAPLFLLGSAQTAATGSIEGTIRVPAGTPAAGVRVSAMVVPGVSIPSTEASVSVSITLTDAQGRFRLTDLPPGRYFITTGAVAGPTYYPGTTSVDSARIVTIGAGTALTGYDFPLITPAPNPVTASTGNRIHRVFGRVVMGDGSPLPKVGLSVNRAGSNSVSFSQSALPPGGAFTLLLEPDVDHLVRLWGLPPEYTLQFVALGNTNVGLGSLKIPPTSTDELVLTVVPVAVSSLKTVKVTGKVANIAPEWKIANRIVELTSMDPGGSTVRVPLNPDNTFVANGVPAGTYQTVIEGLLGQRSVFPVFVVGESDVSGVTINLQDNPFPELPRSPSAPAFDTNNPRTLRGVVTEAVTQIRYKAPFRYFRMDVKDEATGIVTPWAVSYAGTAEIVKLSVGQTVTVSGVPARDGTYRFTLSSINGIPVQPHP